jgi:lipopolysaccharide transport system ATP-binding protein
MSSERGSPVALRASGLGKTYHIGAVRRQRYRTLRDAVAEAAAAPFRRAGKLLRGQATGAAELDEVLWALRDVSFEIAEGEVVGIIGRNGAGKSTLLKVLSRITEPTAGFVEIRGRVGSLLEVGTGFHPELTGRENVYLNGAILGMTRAEIARKFDEIVAFAETEKFIDTPVKHYSSGMSVRLAFAVAAHLEPEILLIDEVLAVGDVAFQRKCLSKMDEVADKGRTVLFISHNMAMVDSLCERSILLQGGRLVEDGPTRHVIDRYLEGVGPVGDTALHENTDRSGTGDYFATKLELVDGQGRIVDHAITGDELTIRLHYDSRIDRPLRDARVNVLVKRDERYFFVLATETTEPREVVLEGKGVLEVTVPELPLGGGQYELSTYIGSGQIRHDFVENAAKLSVVDGDFFGNGRNSIKGTEGKSVLVRHRWRVPTAARGSRV